METVQPDPSWTTGRPCASLSEGLHEVLARTALSRPDAPALVSGHTTVTYGELNRTADAWAARLAEAGVTRGARVPILLPRSVELVIALLAVLKTGAAYALLDPAWPARRITEAAEDLAAGLVVCWPDAGCPDLGLPVWSPPEGPVTVPDGYRPAAVGGGDPACVFFTSGTTGRPKGVLTPHWATARLFQHDGFARFGAHTVMPLAAPAPWDAFSLELWSVLLNGGTSLVVEEPYLSAGCLRAAVETHGTDTVWLTGSLFNMIVDEDVDAFQGLRQVMIGGERLSAGHVARFVARHPVIVLLNGYGPVESTVFATTHRVTAADCERPGGIPLGRPVPGTQVHVLDGVRPCAVGETGEICIAGEGLALGYLGDEELTRARFTHVRVGGRRTRVYRTGDLGVWSPDGLLHFRGRADRQVKIRGHRIEPAEIERQVERLLPAVRHCRVLPRPGDGAAARDLVAFCVPETSGDPLDAALGALNLVLAPYHRPAAVVSVPAFPVTERGKLDEGALLSMAPSAADQAGADIEAASDDPVDRLVAAVFREVLGGRDVPRDVPLVELGGDSLAAGRVCARLSARLDRPVPVSRVYRHPTVAALATWLRTTEDQDGRDGAPAACDVAPLTPMQVVYLTKHLASPGDRTAHCLLTWTVEGELDRAALEAAVVAVHRRHEPLRAVYLADPRPAAWTSPDIPPPPLEVLPARPDVEAAAGALRAALAGPLELTGGEVWRTALVPVAPDLAVFGAAVHHIAFDGWSESVLAADLADAYNHGHCGPAPRPPRPRRHPVAADLADHRDYLLDELTAVPELRWPADEVDPLARGPRHLESPLAPAVVAGVDELAARLGVTRFAALLALCASSLAEVTGQRDFAVGVPIAQRYGPALDRVVGCHINMLGVRLRGGALDGGPAAVRETGNVVARAFAAQDVPFPEVLRLVNPPRTGRPPIYQTLFALQDNAPAGLALSGLRTAFVRQPYLELPLELHTELWPRADGGLRMVVSYRPQMVAESTAEEFAKRFADRLHTIPS
ncbi:amino acid adenylation domain-containing protein [Nonomuraea sp. NPDC050547]|uniref:amino acid adenylation domain-containing protein n=1 Tax=Nonomuraea sp. NPDC050547 TaxID=3364368 RepID=UPI0037A6159E